MKYRRLIIAVVSMAALTWVYFTPAIHMPDYFDTVTDPYPVPSLGNLLFRLACMVWMAVLVFWVLIWNLEE